MYFAHYKYTTTVLSPDQTLCGSAGPATLFLSLKALLVVLANTFEIYSDL